jgi:hypothetical protein
MKPSFISVCDESESYYLYQLEIFKKKKFNRILYNTDYKYINFYVYIKRF